MSRGFSLLAGVLSVAAVTAVLLVPFPLRRISTHVARVEYAAFAQGLDTIADQCSLGCLTRTAQRVIARHRRYTPALSAAFSAPPCVAPHASAWVTLAPGIRYRSVSFTARSGESMHLHQVSLDPKTADLRVTVPSEAAPVAAIGEASKALAAVNASYFDENRHPLGYLKCGGRIINGSVASGAAFTGVFTMKGSTARIVPRASFDGHQADTALQAGPRLVADGAPTAGLRETRSFRQSGVAVTRAGQVVIYATDGSYRGVSWNEMQRLLTGPTEQGGLDARDVLNLDGGSSSQIYVRTQNGRVTTGFPTPVPVVLAMYRR